MAMSADTARELLHAYTAAVLPFQLGAQDAIAPLPHDTIARDKAVAQACRAVARAGRPHFILLGVGDGSLADALAQTLPEDTTMTVVSLAPHQVRHAQSAGRLGWWQKPGRHRLVADTSSWAVLALLAQTGLHAEAATMMLHPVLDAVERNSVRRWQRLFTGSLPLYGAPDGEGAVAAACNSVSGLTVGLIVHDAEPHLEDFFRQVPPWLHEVLVVWDAADVPAQAQQLSAACAVPVRHTARLLCGNFAEQRNAVLAACATERILFLDGDERLAPAAWEQIRRMAGEHAAFALPRWTYLNGTEHCRVGFGLWPDIQLRMFRIGPETRFVNAVHEQVSGLNEPVVLALSVHLDHYSHIWKDASVLAAKLRTFDAAAGQDALHRVNTEYPQVPSALLGMLENGCPSDSGLVLPATGMK